MAYAHVQTIFLGNSGTAISMRPTDGGGANFTTGSRVLLRLRMVRNTGDPIPTVSSVTDQTPSAISGAVVLANCTLTQATDLISQIVIDIPSMPAGVTQIVINISSAPTFGTFVNMSEYTGLGTSAADASNGTSTSYGTGADAVLSGSVTAANQPALVWACAEETSFGSTTTSGTGATDRGFGNAVRVEDKRITATGSTQLTFNNAHGSSSAFLTAIVVIDEPGAGGGATVVPAANAQRNRRSTGRYM